MADSVVKELRITRALLAELLSLPAGVEIAAVRDGQYGMIEVVIVDPKGKLTGSRVYDRDKKKWVVSPEKRPTIAAIVRKSSSKKAAIS